MRHHPAPRLELVELAEIELHHERPGAGVGTLERRRERRIVRPEQVNGASEIHGVVLAVERPDGAPGVRGQAAEQAEREEPAAHCSTHTTSVRMEPSARNSRVR